MQALAVFVGCGTPARHHEQSSYMRPEWEEGVEDEERVIG